LVIGYAGLLHPAATALWHLILPGWEPGLIALILNGAVAIVVSRCLDTRTVQVPAGS
jgi:SSS family solute:Na+ symporter